MLEKKTGSTHSNFTCGYLWIAYVQLLANVKLNPGVNGPLPTYVCVFGLVKWPPWMMMMIFIYARCSVGVSVYILCTVLCVYLVHRVGRLANGWCTLRARCTECDKNVNANANLSCNYYILLPIDGLFTLNETDYKCDFVIRRSLSGWPSFSVNRPPFPR